MRILMISSEVESFARTGGLGDAVEGLSRALAAEGADVVIVTPRYGVTRMPRDASWWSGTVPAHIGWVPHDDRAMGVLETRLEPIGPLGGGTVRVFLLDDPELFARQGIYGDANGEFGDNARRFAALSRGALSVADRLWGGVASGGGPDVLHAHDWHASFAILYARLTMGPAWAALPSVFTIHNLAFQGVLGEADLPRLALPHEAYRGDVLENFGSVNLLKGAVALADRVLAVSRSYAREILEPAFGNGLDGFLRDHASKIIGIENGVDIASFDPTNDGALPERYDATSFAAARATNKAALLAEVGLEPGGDHDAPLFAAVTRLSEQKGIDLLLEIVPALAVRGARILLVGQGDPLLEKALRDIAAQYPGRVAARIAFDAHLARRVYGATDFLVIPSRFEPCGLTQMYAMRYGAIPIVTPVGGLKDTVQPLDACATQGTGLVARGRDVHDVFLACENALALYRDKDALHGVVRRAMARDSSWTRAAKAHLKIYETIARVTSPPPGTF